MLMTSEGASSLFMNTGYMWLRGSWRTPSSPRTTSWTEMRRLGGGGGGGGGDDMVRLKRMEKDFGKSISVNSKKVLFE